MSDKNFVPASGQIFQVRKLPEGMLQVSGEKDDAETCSVKIDAAAECIDHQTLRIVWAAGKLRRRLLWVYSTRGKRVLSWPGGSMELDAVELSENCAQGNTKLRPLKITMPGKVVAVKVKEGDLVEAEQGLVIVEAMKMENLLLAAARARVAKVHVSVGDRLENGALLITFEEV